jgi:hypothetical protein
MRAMLAPGRPALAMPVAPAARAAPDIPMAPRTAAPAAAKASPSLAEAEPLSPREAALLDALERVLSGGEDATGLVMPGRLLVGLVRILLRKGLVDKRDLVGELRIPPPDSAR